MKGIGVSPGISIGNACIINKVAAVISGTSLETQEAKDIEAEKFDKAVLGAVEEVQDIREKKVISHSREEIDILDTQIEFLTDPQIRSDVLDKIQIENKTASDAVIEVIFSAASMFSEMEDGYLKTRAADLQDIGNRILNCLDKNTQLFPCEFDKNTIIIADDLSPSDTIALDVNKVAGFATVTGGKTSHAAIIAKARGIPAVVACGKDLLKTGNNDTIILDGTTGDVIISPDSFTIEEYKRKQKKIIEELSLLKKLKDLPAKTIDGHTVKMLANISDHTDLEQVFENGGEGVGLFRTELLFLGRTSFPSEEEQFQFYKLAAIKSKGKPVIVRTIDIGGDKQLSYFGIPHENNPFLGYRAIRICLDQKDIFLTQLRSILRASVFGDLKIMFPMISSIDEIRSAKECVQQAKEELIKSGINFRNDIETGIMIEVPGAALMADIFAREVDFFSIGTNDLCQYTLAVDRMNEKVSGLYDHFNPGLLRLIKNVIEQAHKHDINVGICGEMASDPLATMLLLGMGMDELSMGSASIPFIKNIIIKNSFANAREVCSKVMDMDNSGSIKRYLKEVSE
jgi:phosphotransferase system enzyme I (PtsI)